MNCFPHLQKQKTFFPLFWTPWWTSVTGWVSSITVQTVRGDGTWYLYITTLIAMPQPGWIRNDVGYLHTSGKKKRYTVLFKIIVGVLTTCHTLYTSDRSICIFLFNRTTLQVFVTYLTGALYVHPLWFYKHQHDNRVHSKLFVAYQQWWFQWQFWFVPSVPGYLREEEEHIPDPWRNPIKRNHMGLHLENKVARRVASDHHWSHATILVNCAPSGEMDNYCTPHIIKENFENFLIHRCNYTLPSQVYCLWQVVKTLTIIFNNPVFDMGHTNIQWHFHTQQWCVLQCRIF